MGSSVPGAVQYLAVDCLQLLDEILPLICREVSHVNPLICRANPLSCNLLPQQLTIHTHTLTSHMAQIPQTVPQYPVHSTRYLTQYCYTANELVVVYWHGYLSGVSYRLAYGPADATATATQPQHSCFSKIQIGFTFLVPAHPGSPRKRAVKRVCVCALVAINKRMRQIKLACRVSFAKPYNYVSSVTMTS